MTKRLLLTTATLILLTLPAAAKVPDAAATTPLEPQVQNGIRFLSGGVGKEEQTQLRKLDDDYNVRVALTRADGAYLTDIHVVISDAAGKPLVDTKTSGPILLAQLEPGRYFLEADTKGRMTERRVIDVPKKREHVHLYVALPDTTGHPDE